MGNLNRVQALLGSRLLLPILDGLDEMADAVRGAAIDKINDALRPREGLVLSSRVAEYRQAVHPEDGPHVKLRGAAGIVLQQLDPEDIKVYLHRDAGGSSTAGRKAWDRTWARALDRVGERPCRPAAGEKTVRWGGRRNCGQRCKRCCGRVRGWSGGH